MATTRVHLADDHTMFRDGLLVAILSSQEDIVVVGQSSTTGEETAALIASSERNNTASARSVSITYTLKDPTGHSESLSETVRIGAHKTFSHSFSYVVDPRIPKGLYRLTVSARNLRGILSATASLAIF
jgi:hypothetical protein